MEQTIPLDTDPQARIRQLVEEGVAVERGAPRTAPFILEGSELICSTCLPRWAIALNTDNLREVLNAHVTGHQHCRSLAAVAQSGRLRLVSAPSARPALEVPMSSYEAARLTTPRCIGFWPKTWQGVSLVDMVQAQQTGGSWYAIPHRLVVPPNGEHTRGVFESQH